MSNKNNKMINVYLSKIIVPGAISVLIWGVLLLLNLFVGYKIPEFVKIITVPFLIPFLVSMPLSEMIWGDMLYYFYEHIILATAVYFVLGILIKLTYHAMNKYLFFIAVAVYVLFFTITPTALYHHYLPKPPLINDFYSMEYEDYSTTLVVAGNIEPKSIILYLHGGPADTAFGLMFSNSFREIMQHYAVAYWDQPGGGNSLWKGSVRNISMDELTEKLDETVDFLKSKYPGSKIYLLGHSFGGELGTRYLIDTDRQKKINAWIDVDGCHHPILEWELIKEWLEVRAKERLAEKGNLTKKEIAFYEECLEFVENYPPFEPWNETKMFSYYLEYAGAYVYKEEAPREPFIGEVYYLIGKANFFREKMNIFHSFDIYNDALQTDYTPHMKNISLPTLILWGRHDGCEPLGEAYHFYDNIATPTDEKEMITFENSAHNPMTEEPKEFADAVIKFIDQNK